MLKEKVEDYLRPLSFRSYELILIDSVIDEKIAQKEKKIFGYPSLQEDTLLAQEIALEIALSHFLKLQTHSNRSIKYDLEQTAFREYMDNEFSYPNTISIPDDIWNTWIDFFIRLFDVQFSEDFTKTAFTVRLLNGLIVQCYSPFFFDHINLFKEEKGEALEEVRYVFSFHSQPTISSGEFAEKYKLSREVAQFIKEAGLYCYNVLITSPSDYFLEEFSQLFFNLFSLDERVNLIDQKNKIQTNLSHLVRLHATDDFSAQELLLSSLRMCPDRIFIDALDSHSIFQFCQACVTGHDGSIAALKINSMQEIQGEFLQDVVMYSSINKRFIKKMFAEALDVILFIEDKEGVPALSFYRYSYNSNTEGLELIPLSTEDNQSILNENFAQSTLSKNTYYQQKLNPKPVPSKKNKLQTVDIEAFFETYLGSYKFEKIQNLKSLLKPSIILSRELKEDDCIPLGASKFGGSPDLPFDLAYPYDGEIPYSFVMQLNCDELSTFDTEEIFPNQGILYFFHKFEDETIPLLYDFDGQEGLKKYMKAATIFHYEGDKNKLRRTDRPRSIHLEKVKSAQMQFVSSFTLPHPYEEQTEYEALGFTEEEIEKFIKPFYHALRSTHYKSLEDIFDEDAEYKDEPLHQLMGHALPIQAHPIDELEYEFKGRFNQPSTNKDDWFLLCQLEADYDINMLWAADGFMYYYIEKEAFKQGDFRNIYSIMQCS